ncbi:MAG: M20/M25/M40 family metallo-hydrolase, partial [Alphaproteobacteria bacterium]
RQAPLKRPIHFAFSYDEEIGCRGAPAMIARIARELPSPLAVIVGEPTQMKLVNAHKGLAVYRTTVTGRAAHSSQTQLGASAVMAAGRLIAKLHEIGERQRLTADPHSPFEPPYSTMTANHVAGGTAVNILAEHCSFDWDLRVVPGDEHEAIVAEMRAFARDVLLPDMRRSAPEADIRIEEISAAPALAAADNSAAEALIRALCGTNASQVVAYGTEAGLFQRAGLSTVVCGPGAIAQAHQPDEWIAIEQLAACTALTERLIAHLSN